MPANIHKTTAKEQRYIAILDAARNVFETQGYEKATMADIAKQVGVVEGTVFHYVGSKRALVLKVMERFYEHITIEQRLGLNLVQGIRDRLYFIIHYHFQVIHHNAALCAVILLESRGLESGLTQEIRRLNSGYTHAVNQLIETGIERQEIKPDTSIAFIKNTLFGHIEHSLWSKLAENQTIQIEQAAERLTQMIYSNIATHTVSEPNPQDIKALITKLNNLLP